MKKIVAIFITSMMLLVCGSASAQEKDAAREQAKTGEEAKPQAERTNAVPTPYRLDFSFYELEDGKKINTRHYTLDVTAGSGNEVKIGTRVPVDTGKNTPDPSFNFQYMDVGTRIWASIGILGGGELRLEARGEISNIDIPLDNRGQGRPPIVRQIQINGSTLLVTGKPILIGALDDPNSNRQFQLEVTATKLR